MGDDLNLQKFLDTEGQDKPVANVIRRLVSDPALPGHSDAALPGPSDFPVLSALAGLLIFLLAGFLAFRCLRRFRAKPRRDSFGFLPDHEQKFPLNRAERMV